ncbi:NAD(P)-binding protein [Polychaeton citri CBS 116435]|uniref:NAD(P)-binding protein n=1 Tax=Polychaeton citri CBS 116435 TaxID=1314669 RepID=A0A9P4QCJ4_9PEZI|nr:NAD(P)-binding protein [Polychaeton citri CBS 116435]
MTDQLLVVLGATGNQGNAVLQHFATSNLKHAFQLRGVTRDVNSKKSQQLRDLGVHMVKADLDDRASLSHAFEGATHIFATTDSNRLIFQAIDQPAILKEGQTPRSYARDIELIHGQNIADAASKITNLKRLVWSSLASPNKWSNGRYTKVSMWDTKEEIAEILASKAELQEKVSVILVGFFATNALKVPQLYGPLRQSDGTYELALPMSGDVPIPLIDLDADLGRLVNALFQTDPGTALLGTTETVSWAQWLDLWAQHNKVTAKYRRATPDEYAAKIEGISDAVLEEFAFVEEYGFTGGNPHVVDPDELRNRGVTLERSSLKSHIENHDWTSTL